MALTIKGVRGTSEWCGRARSFEGALGCRVPVRQIVAAVVESVGGAERV